MKDLDTGEKSEICQVKSIVYNEPAYYSYYENDQLVGRDNMYVLHDGVVYR